MLNAKLTGSIIIIRNEKMTKQISEEELAKGDKSND